MATTLHPLRELPPTSQFKKGDVLVLFGELFSRGYANGIVDEAHRAGMTIVRSTVGRRDDEGKLRPLTAEESANIPQPFINIPLEAGFDLEPSDDGITPVEQVAGIKLSAWEDARIDFKKLEQSRARGVQRFKANTQAWLKELERHIPKGANVIFAHLMAGGVPRAKIIMPVMNRVVKGTGDRHLPSEKFWNSDLGKFSAMSFEEVTANTLNVLIEESATLRSKIESDGGTARYVAYGYHGTEVMIKGEYTWQSYAPYLQGWAKVKLEDYAEKAWKSGIKVTVYNCPEILTNSSSIFLGVEVPLYPFIQALKREAPNVRSVQAAIEKCAGLLKPEFNFETLQTFTDQALTSPELRSVCHFDTWPGHNNKAQMEKLIAASESIVDMHKDPKNLITFVLSEEIFRATGYVMFHDSWKLQKPVLWLGHDVLAKALATGRTL
ncbi:MAG TPA: hypothetical protein VM432_13750 [Bdellovibrionales bacterium]|nr:hypothetical protein [Bdellovibrionales bacterium]